MALFARSLATLSIIGIIGVTTAFDISEHLVVRPFLPNVPVAQCGQRDQSGAARGCQTPAGDNEVGVYQTVATTTAALAPAALVGAEQPVGLAVRSPAPTTSQSSRQPLAAAPPAPASARVAAATTAKATPGKQRARRPSRDEAWRLVHSFGDNLSNVPIRAYASAGSQRKNAVHRTRARGEPFFSASDARRAIP